jgi:hypothetical protein
MTTNVDNANDNKRRQMIAEAAYFRAERYGFSGGDALRDWCEAEAELDALLRPSDSAVNDREPQTVEQEPEPKPRARP